MFDNIIVKRNGAQGGEIPGNYELQESKTSKSLFVGDQPKFGNVNMGSYTISGDFYTE